MSTTTECSVEEVRGSQRGEERGAVGVEFVECVVTITGVPIDLTFTFVFFAHGIPHS
jgi:hypothetical protein